MALMNKVLNRFKNNKTAALRISRYFRSPNALYKSLAEVDATYRVTEEVPKLTEEKAIDKYNRYLLSIYEPNDTIFDIIETIFYDYPKLCSDLKKVYIEKKELKATTALPHLLEECIGDKLLLTIAWGIYSQKFVIRALEDKIDELWAEGDTLEAIQVMMQVVEMEKE